MAVPAGGGAHAELVRCRDVAPGRHRAREHVGAVVLAQGAGAAVVQQGLPLGPGAFAVLVLEAPDEGEALAVDGAAGHELQQAVVVEQLGHLADARQHFALAR